MTELKICYCKKVIEGTGVHLNVSLEGTVNDYFYCSTECMNKRINDIPKTNKEMGVDVKIDGIEHVGGIHYLRLSIKRDGENPL
jgi:hypothetical protein